jgi:cbb3-type cytochrome oxidase subunit 3
MAPELAYLVFGLTLCVALAGIAVFAYRRHRRDRIEAPKYEMLKDDE